MSANLSFLYKTFDCSIFLDECLSRNVLSFSQVLIFKAEVPRHTKYEHYSEILPSRRSLERLRNENEDTRLN